VFLLLSWNAAVEQAFPEVVALAEKLRVSRRREQNARCGGRHTLAALSASRPAKEPRCSQTCRKCVWNFHGTIS
jgi:hypothetical protein